MGSVERWISQWKVGGGSFEIRRLRLVRKSWASQFGLATECSGVTQEYSGPRPRAKYGPTSAHSVAVGIDIHVRRTLCIPKSGCLQN
jgi:hypothetical protein